MGGTHPVTPQVDPQVKAAESPVLRLVRVLAGEMSRQELQIALGLRNKRSFRKLYLDPAIEAGLVEMTDPESPRSPQQKYRLSPQGRELAEANR